MEWAPGQAEAGWKKEESRPAVDDMTYLERTGSAGDGHAYRCVAPTWRSASSAARVALCDRHLQRGPAARIDVIDVRSMRDKHRNHIEPAACDLPQTDLPPGRARKSSFKPLNIKDYSETLRGRAYCQRHRHGPGEVQSQSLKDGVLLGIEARQTGRQLPVDLIVQVRETGQGEQRFVEVHRVGIVIGGAEGMV